MKSIIKLLPIIILIAAVIFGLEYYKQKKPSDDVIATAKQIVTPVKTLELKLEQYTQKLRLDGRIEAQYNADLGFQMVGRIKQLGIRQGQDIIPLKEGMHVKKGQVIAKLNTDLLNAKVQQAKSNIQSSNAGIAAAKAQLAFVKTDYNDKLSVYNKELKLKENNASSPRLLEKAKRDKDASEAQFKKAQALLEMENAKYLTSEANLTLENVNLDYATLKSPVDGIISAVPVEIGQLANVGQTIATIVAQDTVNLIVGVTERKISKLKIGQIAKIELNALDQALTQKSLTQKVEQKFTGIITVIPPAANKTSGLFHVEIKIQNKDNILKPGMIGRAYVNLENNLSVYKIPLKSIFNTQQSTWAYFATLDPYDKLIAKRIEFKDGIADGDYYLLPKLPFKINRLIIQGQTRVTDGTYIKEINTPIENNKKNKTATKTKDKK